jgi:hypothetical protein
MIAFWETPRKSRKQALVTSCSRSFVAMLCVLGLSLVTGCSAGTAKVAGSRLSSSCIPPALRLFGPPQAPAKELSIPLAPAILSRFAIFRRSVLPSDEPPSLKSVGGELGRELSKDYDLSGYYPAYVRQLTRLPDGERYFVVPAFARPEAVPPAHCLPAGVQRRELVEQQHRRLVEPIYCIIKVGGDRNAPSPGCEPFAEINESVRVFQASDFTREQTIGLVPDGVASVWVSYPSISPFVVPVSESSFVLTPPPSPLRLAADLKRLEPRLIDRHLTKARRRSVTLQWDKTFAETTPTRIEWLDGFGRLVRTISAPIPGGMSATSVGGLRAPVGG